MKTNQVLIKDRYQYSPNLFIKQNQLYIEHRAQDQLTNKSVNLHIQNKPGNQLQQFKEIKHIFIQQIVDIVQLSTQRKRAVLFQDDIHANLQQILNKNLYLTENDALVIFKYIALALKGLQEKLMTYGRICAENILFCSNAIIKIGWMVYPSQISNECKAPEVFNSQKFTSASDIYSLGVLLYRILYGDYPFEGRDQYELIQNIKNKRFKYPEIASPLKIAITQQLKELMTKMLDYSPEKRPTLKQILDMPLLLFSVQTNLQSYLKPKTQILPEKLSKKYLIIRASKITYRYQDYYEQITYLALNIKQKVFVSILKPEVNMSQAPRRNVQLYLQKLQKLKQQPQATLCEIIHYEVINKESLIITQYCNQGDLYHYLEKRKKEIGWINEKQTNLIMQLVAKGFKRLDEIGIMPLNTMHIQRIMIKNNMVKLRQPVLVTPFLEEKLLDSDKIDYFAPELKQKSDFVALNNTDMWSFGVLYYYLLREQFPQRDPETQVFNIQALLTNQRNKNIVKKCLNQNVEKRLKIDQIRIQGYNEEIMEKLLQEEQKEKQFGRQIEYREDYNKVQQKSKLKNATFSFTNFNKTLVESSTSNLRIGIRVLLGLIILWVVFFGKFIINGGMGVLKTKYYRKVTFQVPNNYGTSLSTITILTTNGTAFALNYGDYSYQQIITSLNCTLNSYSPTAKGEVHEYINQNYPTQCFFGFVYLILFSICYMIIQVKLDFPKIMLVGKENWKKETGFFVFFFFIQTSLLFCFFYIFVLDYMIQMNPCLGFENQAYPKFTSIQTLYNGNIGQFFYLVFPTVILWSLAMFSYILLGLLIEFVNVKIKQRKYFAIAIGFMAIQTIICRIGFGGPLPLFPTWSYQISKDITSKFWGLFGFFPQILFICVFVMERIIDMIFWFILKYLIKGQEPSKIKANEDSIANFNFVTHENLQESNAGLKGMQNDIQIFT